jgi:hypothetical protein
MGLLSGTSSWERVLCMVDGSILRCCSPAEKSIVMAENHSDHKLRKHWPFIAVAVLERQAGVRTDD